MKKNDGAQSFHIGKNGSEECNANEYPCPLGGEHFQTLKDADDAVAAQYGGSFGGRRLPNLSIPVNVIPFAGGRYYGAHIKNRAIEPFLKEFRQEVGANAAYEMEAAKEQRDRGRVYHLTIVGPPEMKTLGKNFEPFPTYPTIEFCGVGKAVDGDNEAWFAICRSAEIAEWRERNGLPPKDLHVTLGFKNKDVHTKSKGADSTVIR